MNKLTPLGNTALLSPARQVQSGGGIALPTDYSNRECMQWLVCAVGPGRKLKNGQRLTPEVKAGDLCLYHMNNDGNRHAFADGCILVDIDKIKMVWR